MKQNFHTTSTMEYDQSIIRKPKKAFTLSPELMANKYKSFEQILGKQLSTMAVSMKGNLSTEDSDVLISQSTLRKKNETATLSPNKIKKKITKIIEIQLGPHSKALIDKVVEEDLVDPRISEKKIDEELEKTKAILKSDNNFQEDQRKNYKISKNYQNTKSWADCYMLNLGKSKSIPDGLEIKSYQHLPKLQPTLHVITDHKINKRSKDFPKTLLESNRTPEKINTYIEASPLDSTKSFLRRRKTNTTILLPSLQKPKRMKNYKIKQISNVNLFEGLPYIGYESYVKKDFNMQKIIVKDVLKVLFEKAHSLKNTLADRYRIHQVFHSTTPKNLDEFNKKLEETIGLMLEISLMILQEFQDEPEKIGITSKPRERDEDEWKVFQESDALQENLKYLCETTDFLKDSIETYMIMRRQKDREILNDASLNNLIKDVSRCRYNMGELKEHYMIFEKNYLDKKKRGDTIPVSPMRKFKTKKTIMSMTPREMETKKEMEKIKEKKQDFAKKIQFLSTLLKNKFNLNKLKLQTREAKVNLNQEDFETKKALLILEDEKTTKFPIANNVKKIQMERMKNPFSKDDEMVGFSRGFANIMILDHHENGQ